MKFAEQLTPMPIRKKMLDDVANRGLADMFQENIDVIARMYRDDLARDLAEQARGSAIRTIKNWVERT